MSKEAVIVKLIPVFRQYGYEGTTLSMLSQASGLGKASLYHHFPQGKESMADAVMAYVAVEFERAVLQPLKSDRQPIEKLKAMCQGLNEFYAAGENSCFLAIMSVGEADNLFHARIKQQLQTWIETTAEVLIEVGIEPAEAKMRSQHSVIEIQGALVLVRIIKDTTIFENIIASLPQKMLQQA